MAAVADNIVATLNTSGIQRIAGLPGDSLNGATDALRRAGAREWGPGRGDSQETSKSNQRFTSTR
jgi:thiamine pyrophosphate-dependent acetolactate synthase large subunit-like protein